MVVPHDVRVWLGNAVGETNQLFQDVFRCVFLCLPSFCRPWFSLVQEREWRAEEEAWREAGLLEEPAAVEADDSGSGGSGAGPSGSKAEGSAGPASGSGAGGLGGRWGLSSAAGADVARAAAEGAVDVAAGRVAPMDYVNALALTVAMRHNVIGGMARRDDHCDCDACRRERQHRLGEEGGGGAEGTPRERQVPSFETAPP